MITKLELFKNVMYYMFNEESLPELTMEDMSVMWAALLNKWNIVIHPNKWEQFLDEINCKKNEEYMSFSNKFNEYFYE